MAEVGHVNATFKLARQLRARGHDIHYLSLPDVEEHVRSQGWGFTPLFGHLFPKGYRETTDAFLSSSAPAAERRAVAIDMRRRTRAHCVEMLFGADFEARLQESQADLLLIPAARAHRGGWASRRPSSAPPAPVGG